MTNTSPLGKSTDFPRQYSPDLLFAIAREENRSSLGLLGELPFHGSDIWNAWELTWLDNEGLPHVASAEIRIPADSRNIVESKSLKLYLGAFAMSEFVTSDAVAATLRKDIGNCVGSDVEIRLYRPDETRGGRIEQLEGVCIDNLSLSCKSYEVDAGLLRASTGESVSESVHSHLLRSLCPVTGQPDSGSVQIRYRGPRLDHNGLLRYIVSFRQHADFHENCVERMFIDLLRECSPDELTVYARYQRRGGIDINPFRSNFETTARNTRLWRQ